MIHCLHLVSIFGIFLLFHFSRLHLPTEDEDFYEEEFSDEYYDEYEGEECDFEDEYEMEDMEDMEEMDMEDEKVCFVYLAHQKQTKLSQLIFKICAIAEILG